MLLPATGFVLAASLILGGGTRSGFLGDAVLQILSVAALLVVLNRMFSPELAPDGMRWHTNARWAFAVCAVVWSGPILQLIPLPPGVWTRLPDRALISRSYELLSQPLPWFPISMVPSLTWTAWLSLLPPTAIFLGTALIGYRQRRQLSLVLLSVGLASVLLGLLQIAQGPDSSLRFFDYTNSTDAVGFFANRNHFAALLYCLTVFAAAWAIDTVIITKTANRWFTSSMLIVIASFTMLVVLIGAQSMARSRAGIGLSLAALASTFALAAFDRRTQSAKHATRLLAGAVMLALLFTVQLALFRILDRFDRDSLVEGRIAFTQRTYAIAQEHLLTGTGLGTFVAVFPLYERTEELLANTYVNHAHNDIAQLLMEAGAGGGVLMLGFGLWLAARAFGVWWPAASGPSDLDRALARSSVVVIALLMLHSVVDYPLRTGAMLAVFAFAAGLLVPPPPQSGQAWPVSGPGASPPASPAQRGQNAPPPNATAVTWPGAWQRPKDGGSSPPPVATSPRVGPTMPDDCKP